MIVYTAIYAGRDTFKIKIPPGIPCEIHLFTDSVRPPAGVIVHEGPLWIRDPVRRSRCVKILSHLWLPPHDISVWVDASFYWRGFNPEAVSRIFLATADIATLKRYQIDCAYEEARICEKMALDRPELIRAQMNHYRSAGLPRNFGLHWTAVVFRRDNEAVRRLNESWWAEVSRWSRRDQLSLPYVLWKTGTPIASFDTTFESIGLVQTPHAGPLSPP